MAGADSHIVRIAVGKRDSLGRVANVDVQWSKLVTKCSQTERSTETLAEYLAYDIEKQHGLKNVGFFVGGHCEGGWRNSASVKERWLIVLDVDWATPELLQEILSDRNGLSRYEFFTYSTRKHTPDKPRIRVVIPLASPVMPMAFNALSRILASKLDPSMMSVDQVCFRIAQLMYFPSTCLDAEFFFHHNPGSLCEPGKVLDDFGTWRDWKTLPFSQRQGQKRPTDLGHKAEVPTDKKGIVGAFCRTYNIFEAIDKFLPDIYRPGEEVGGKPRYSFCAGTTSNGAVVEDDGLFLYSYHTSDPCNERLVNAFDLVRIHKFGDLDKEYDDDERPGAAPSFKAMLKFLADDEAIKKELRQEQYDTVAMFEDLDQTDPETTQTAIEAAIDAPSEKPDMSWMDRLALDAKGRFVSSLTNIAMILSHDPRLSKCVQRNEFSQEIVTRKQIRSKMELVPKIDIYDTVNGDLWSDRRDTALRMLLEAPKGKKSAGYGLTITDRDLRAAVCAVAERNPFHPVREYLQSLKWDGKRRIEKVFVQYLRSPDNEYVREACRLMFLGAVTRIFEPGHKFDFVAILEGLQGKGKSTFIEILARHWFANLDGPFDDRKRLVESMQGAWILELPELSVFGKSEIAEIKAFVSITHDKTRLAYERRAAVFARQCIFVGSTNDRKYLKDDTGGRRFWPIPVNVKADLIDLNKFRANVDQMWAEAVIAYYEMRADQPFGVLPLFLQSEGARLEALKMQESRRIDSAEDSLAGQIQHWLDTPVAEADLNGTAHLFEDLDAPKNMMLRETVCLLQIWVECLGASPERYNSQQAQILSKAMRLIPGWEQGGDRELHPIYGRQRIYYRDYDSMLE